MTILVVDDAEDCIVTMDLVNQDVDHVTVLIHGTPQILLLAVDSNEDFVQVPNIAEAALTPLQFSGTARAELLTRIVS